MIERLPDDMSTLDGERLRHERDTRDERISLLFRRWPALTKVELTEIRRLHDERQRLARHVGVLRKQSRAASAST